MNALYTFTPPETDKSEDWSQAVESFCDAFDGTEQTNEQVTEVLDSVRAAVKAQKVRFKRGDVPEALAFLNGVLGSLQRVTPSVTPWDLQDLVPPCCRVFVVPDDREFRFAPMFTL